MNIEAVKTRIKLHEGFRLEPYTDTEGFLTGGFGHKILDGETLPTTKEGWEELFDKDFDRAYEGAMEIFEGKVDNIYTQGLDQNTIDVVKGLNKNEMNIFYTVIVGNSFTKLNVGLGISVIG